MPFYIYFFKETACYITAKDTSLSSVGLLYFIIHIYNCQICSLPNMVVVFPILPMMYGFTTAINSLFLMEWPNIHSGISFTKNDIPKNLLIFSHRNLEDCVVLCYHSSIFNTPNEMFFNAPKGKENGKIGTKPSSTKEGVQTACNIFIILLYFTIQYFQETIYTI